MLRSILLSRVGQAQLTSEPVIFSSCSMASMLSWSRFSTNCWKARRQHITSRLRGAHTYYVGDTEVLVHNMCAKKRDIRQVEQAARELKMNDHQRHAFGDYIESLKWDLPNDKNFSYKELIEIGKAFLEAINDD